MRRELMTDIEIMNEFDIGMSYKTMDVPCFDTA
jgi:hypothetical protein